MTTFPGSPRVLKGALVAINLPDPTLKVIAFQYNPVTLMRSLQGQTTGEGEGAADGTVRFKGPPAESIEVSVEIDLTGQQPKNEGTESGIHPQLAALEMLLYPHSSRVLSNINLLSFGAIEIVAPAAPFTIFIFGPKRILPVQLTSFSITEEAFDTKLNPIRANVSLSLRVLSYNDLLPEHPGHALFLAHQMARETMARGVVINSLNTVTGSNTNLV